MIVDEYTHLAKVGDMGIGLRPISFLFGLCYNQISVSVIASVLGNGQ